MQYWIIPSTIIRDQNCQEYCQHNSNYEGLKSLISPLVYSIYAVLIYTNSLQKRQIQKMQILMSLKKKKYLINYTNMSQGNWKGRNFKPCRFIKTKSRKTTHKKQIKMIKNHLMMSQNLSEFISNKKKMKRALLGKTRSPRAAL